MPRSRHRRCSNSRNIVQFLDKVRIEPSAVRAEGSLVVDPAAEYLKDHFPGAPMLPGLVMLEASVRTATALWSARRGPIGAVLERVHRLQVVRRVVPGERFVVQVEWAGEPQEARAAFAAKGQVGGETAMRAQFDLVIRNNGVQGPRGEGDQL